jgi:hypothetical protein
MPLVARKASKKQKKLRLFLHGPSGSGKTYSALKIMRELVGPTGKILVLDTEGGSAEDYADEFSFDVVTLDTFHPKGFTDAMNLAESEYDGFVCDSLSHFWNGPGGLLSIVDRNFNKWSTATPLQDEMIRRILNTKVHLIGCARAKQDYVQEQKDGKTVISKVGMNPIQRDGFEYEFQIVGSLNMKNVMTIVKSRLNGFIVEGDQFEKPGADFVNLAKQWLERGEEEPDRPKTKDEFARVLLTWGIKGPQIKPTMERLGLGVYSEDRHDELLTAIRLHIASSTEIETTE